MANHFLFMVQESNTKLSAEDLALPTRIIYENIEAEEPLRKAGLVASDICYQAQAPRLRAHYPYDPEPDMLLCNEIVNGHTGSGKKIISYIVKLLSGDMREFDKQQRRLLQECTEANNRKGGKEQKQQEPLVIIRLLQDFSLPIITKYADMHERRFGEPLGFFLHSDEVGQVCDKRNAQKNLQGVARTAFSITEEYVKDTLYAEGYNAYTNICWNSVICSQTASLNDYITKKGLLCGDGGRQIVIDIGEELAPEPPIFHPLSEEQKQVVDETIQRLKNETFTFTSDGEIAGLQPIHMIDMSWLYPDINNWCEEQRDLVATSGSRALEAFYVRASVSSFRLSAMQYHLWDELPEHQDKVRRFYLYFAQKILDAQMDMWGKMYEAALPKPQDTYRAKLVYPLFPESFTEEQAVQILEQNGIKTPWRSYKSKWKKKKWIYFEEDTKLFHKMFEPKSTVNVNS
jgi:hypothetical protein